MAAAATVGLLLIAFAATMAVQAQRIARERDRANREARLAQQVSGFLVGMFETTNPFQGRGKTRPLAKSSTAGRSALPRSSATSPR